MGIIVAILILILFLVITGFVFLKYFQLWKRMEWNSVSYWIIHILLFINFICGTMGYFGFGTELIRNVFLRLAGIYMVVYVYSAVFLAVRQLIIVIGNKFELKNKFFRAVKSTKKGIAAIFFVSLLLGIVGVIEMRWYVYTNYNVNIEKSLKVDESEKSLNKKSFRIALISDAHIGTGVLRSDLQRVADKINEANPDIVVFDGDFFDQSTTVSQMEKMTSVFKNIKAPYGKYYVEGNHEVYLNEDRTKYFKDAGMVVLEDKTTKLANGIQIVGRLDFADSRMQTDAKELLKDVDKNLPIIVLSHQPHQFKELSAEGVDLVMSGHTHGGQMFGNFLTYLVNDMNYGIKSYGKMSAITSSGIGGWGLPVKVGFPSEVVVIDMNFK